MARRVKGDAPSGVLRHVLTQRQAFLAATWLKEAEIRAGDTYITIAERAEAALGFKVNGSNIKHLMLTVEREMPGQPPKTDDRLAALESALVANEVRLSDLALRTANAETLVFLTMEALYLSMVGPTVTHPPAAVMEVTKRLGGYVREMRNVLASASRLPVIGKPPQEAKHGDLSNPSS